MKRGAMMLLLFTVIWAALALGAILAIYRAADDPARDGYFDNRGKWYTATVDGWNEGKQ